jgi:hypothetical protein
MWEHACFHSAVSFPEVPLSPAQGVKVVLQGEPLLDSNELHGLPLPACFHFVQQDRDISLPEYRELPSS